ncbi:hypothetical protein TRVL_06164 [Trypanosoma vivax]|nr:hypothetical protein TRVL_06164 [Trypanosoma vivax]
MPFRVIQVVPCKVLFSGLLLLLRAFCVFFWLCVTGLCVLSSERCSSQTQCGDECVGAARAVRGGFAGCPVSAFVDFACWLSGIVVRSDVCFVAVCLLSA